MSSAEFPSVAELTQLQIETVARWHHEPIRNPYQGIKQLVCAQHEFNFRLWHEEDTARSPTANDQEIANVKRAIDKLNQARNDMIEKGGAEDLLRISRSHQLKHDQGFLYQYILREFIYLLDYFGVYSLLNMVMLNAKYMMHICDDETNVKYYNDMVEPANDIGLKYKKMYELKILT